ncbi:MAG: hypothetical protein AAFW82_02330 [Pseudomonadota bacterium]
MSNLQMPAAREFGWSLKPISSSLFDICKRDNGQFCVVLNHALLRGVRAEMVHWWFLVTFEVRERGLYFSHQLNSRYENTKQVGNANARIFCAAGSVAMRQEKHGMSA